MKTLRVVLLERGKPAEPKTLPYTLDDLQAAVGGLLQKVTLALPGLAPVDAYVNEEGLLLDLPRTAVLPVRTYGGGQVLTPLHGPILFIGPADAEGETLDLPEDQVQKLVDFFAARG
jgi:hypothetical protein